MKVAFKNRLGLFFIIGLVICLLLILLVANRFLFFEKTIALIDKVDVVWMGYTQRKLVALTFDDGPDPVFTPQILRILKKYKVPATFFIEGVNVYKYPNLVRAEIKAGHIIGNHTFSHPRLSKLPFSNIQAEIIETDWEIKHATGKTPVFFRPPYEEINGNILNASRELHKKIILSTITLEHVSAKNPREKAARVIRYVFPGAIILAHDGRLNRSQTVEALPYLIERLLSKGYQFVSLNTLLGKRPLKPGN
ncbi:MAG: polysaccharide deacetylase family protein [Bacillota bacterium]